MIVIILVSVVSASKKTDVHLVILVLLKESCKIINVSVQTNFTMMDQIWIANNVIIHVPHVADQMIRIVKPVIKHKIDLNF